MPRVLNQFKNYLEIANSNIQNQKLYFFIKNSAFTKAFNNLQKDSSEISENDKKTFEYLLQEFKKEKQLYGNNINLSKEEYYKFIEEFYSKIDFDNANLEIIELCRDLTELVYAFGGLGLDDLTKRRIDYFTKRIEVLQTNNYINAYKNKNANILSMFEPKPETKIVTAPSKGLEDFPEVKEAATNYSYKKMDSVILDYIPTLVDKNIKLPISKNTPEYNKVKEIIKTHIEYSTLELDFHKLEIAKDHVEAAIYYLRNIK